MSVLVVGDIMLDRYWHGAVERLSQEAPVPVVRMGSEECRAGAAANVAANCSAMGERVTLIGIIGHDECADLVFDLLFKAQVNAFILSDPGIKTIQKLRIIGRSQQIVRVDFDTKTRLTITEKALEQIALHDVVVFSDYDKGTLIDVRKMIAYAKSIGKVVLVDPKGYDYSKYSGADLVKPNIDEMKRIVGGWESEEDLQKKAERVRVEAGIGAILLTRAGEGMTLYDAQGAASIPAKAREVYDVTGAGDTVMAALAVMLSGGRSMKDAALVANYAAGVAVGKFGTATVSLGEIKEAMLETR